MPQLRVTSSVEVDSSNIPPPHLFSGTSTRDGRLTARVSSVEYESRTTEVVDGVWSNLIVGPSGEDAVPDGASVTFKLDGQMALQMPVWVSGKITRNLALTFEGSPPPPPPPPPPPLPVGDVTKAAVEFKVMLEEEIDRIRNLLTALDQFLAP